MQMANAVRGVGLEPLVIAPHDAHTLKATIYAYVRAGIPVLMGMELLNTSAVAAGAALDPHSETAAPERIGLHAVAVTGYSLGGRDCEPYGPTGLNLRATRIDKFYVHDDQVGPFSRMVFRPGTEPHLDTSYGQDENGEQGTIFAGATTVLIPLYPKIRISFAAVHDALPELEEAIVALFYAAQKEHWLDELEWDVRLTRVQQLKSEIRNSKSLPQDYKRALVEMALPRFLWVAEAYNGQEPLFTLLFDATDLKQGNWLVAFIEHHQEVCSLLRALAEPDIIARLAKQGFSPTTLRLLEQVRETPTPQE